MQTTVKQFFKQFPNDDACLKRLFDCRYGQGYGCPTCKRTPKWYRLNERPVFSCQYCGHHIYPMAGTIFEDSHSSLQSWFYAIYLFTTTRSGVSAKELQRQLGVTYKTAWRMGHQIRKHMDAVNGSDPLSGIVEVDEAMIGGVRPGKRGRGAAGKTVMLGMLQRDGDVKVKAVPDVRRATLQPIIEASVTKGAEIHTDEFRTYGNLQERGYTHKTVNHGAKQYAVGNTHVNTLEGFWARLCLSIRGTHVHVSGKHLDKYAGEFAFRFNRRKDAASMLPDLLSVFPPPSR